MQDHYWIVERYLNGKWYAIYALPTRSNARQAASKFACPTRIRKFVAA